MNFRKQDIIPIVIWIIWVALIFITLSDMGFVLLGIAVFMLAAYSFDLLKKLTRNLVLIAIVLLTTAGTLYWTDIMVSAFFDTHNREDHGPLQLGITLAYLIISMILITLRNKSLHDFNQQYRWVISALLLGMALCALLLDENFFNPWTW